MKKYIHFLLITISFYYCTVAQNKAKTQNFFQNHYEIKNLVNNYLQNYHEKEIVVNEKIIQAVWSQKSKIEDLFNSNQFSLIKNFKMKSNKQIIDFGDFFSKEDFASMKRQVKKHKVENWSRFIDSKYFSKKTNKTKVSLSMPVFVKNKSFAIIYLEFPNSGELRILKKINNEWEYVATGFVWSSD